MIGIRDKEDIRKIVDAFYIQIREDQMRGYLFDEVAKTDWNIHLPKMYRFWDHILFDSGAYRGQPFLPHLALNAQVKLSPAHFERWFRIFETTVDALFAGPKVEDIKKKARTIKDVWSFKIEDINTQTTENTHT